MKMKILTFVIKLCPFRVHGLKFMSGNVNQFDILLHPARVHGLKWVSLWSTFSQLHPSWCVPTVTRYEGAWIEPSGYMTIARQYMLRRKEIQKVFKNTLTKWQMAQYLQCKSQITELPGLPAGRKSFRKMFTFREIPGKDSGYAAQVIPGSTPGYPFSKLQEKCGGKENG